jgi:hypothetical protein
VKSNLKGSNQAWLGEKSIKITHLQMMFPAGKGKRVQYMVREFSS